MKKLAFLSLFCICISFSVSAETFVITKKIRMGIRSTTPEQIRELCIGTVKNQKVVAKRSCGLMNGIVSSWKEISINPLVQGGDSICQVSVTAICDANLE